MIVFSGNLNDECKAYMRKRNILSWILSVSIVFIFVRLFNLARTPFNSKNHSFIL